MYENNKITSSKADLMRIMIRPLASWGWAFNESQVETLYPMVSHFTVEALEQGTQVLLKESKWRPKPAEIIAACSKFSNGKAGNGWEQKIALRQAERYKKIFEYTENLMLNSEISVIAHRQGWEDKLENFVRLTAGSMQDMIDSLERNSYAWSSNAVPRDYQHVYKQLLKDSVKTVKESGIDVLLALPDMAGLYWATEASKAPPSTSPPTAFETHCNAIVERLKRERERLTA